MTSANSRAASIWLSMRGDSSNPASGYGSLSYLSSVNRLWPPAISAARCSTRLPAEMSPAALFTARRARFSYDTSQDSQPPVWRNGFCVPRFKFHTADPPIICRNISICDIYRTMQLPHSFIRMNRFNKCSLRLVEPFHDRDVPTRSRTKSKKQS